MDIFQEIVKPIADLAQNFNINLSDFLQRYLSRLRRVSSHESLVNFAHAALVVQSSSDIYSRKVDFLYQSVIQLIELMNSGNQKSDTDVKIGEKEPGKIRKPRRRRPASLISIEDFVPLCPSVSDKQLTLNVKHKKHHFKHNEKWKMSMLGRLVGGRVQRMQDTPVFDEEQECMGQLSDFRLSWFIGPDLTLAETLQERIGDHNIANYDARVSSMPTPEYSDEGMGGITDQALMTGLESDHNDKPDMLEPVAVTTNVEPDHHGDHIGHDMPEPQAGTTNVEPDHCEEHIITEPFAEQGKPEADLILITNKEAQLIRKDIAQSKQKTEKKWTLMEALQFEDRPHHPKRVFALSPELRAKSMARPRFPMTKFLMSHMLKRQLHMGGIEPHIVATQIEEEKCIKKLVQDQIKKFNLVRKPAYELSTLIEEQSDFHGFDVVEDCEDPPDSPVIETRSDYEAILTPPLSRSLSPASPAPASGKSDYQEAVESEMMAYRAKRNAPQSNDAVTEWHRSIKDKLENASKNSVFDVHEYGSKILSKFKSIGMEMTMQELAAGLDSPEVARYFVSVLMLANTENLELSENGPDTLRVKLLSRERHHEMEEFLVPCAQPQKGGRKEGPTLKQSMHKKKTQLSARSLPNIQPVIPPTCTPEIPALSSTPSPHPGPSGLQPPFSPASSVSLSITPLSSLSLHIFSPASNTSRISAEKRKRDLELDSTPTSFKRPRKQLSGKGPWVNKSKR